MAALAGVGIGLRLTDRGLMVTEILPGQPVDRSGKVQVGDILSKVDGRVCDNVPTNAKRMLIGPTGTSVTLTLLRENILGSPESIVVDLERSGQPIPTDRAPLQDRRSIKAEFARVRAISPPPRKQVKEDGGIDGSLRGSAGISAHGTGAEMKLAQLLADVSELMPQSIGGEERNFSPHLEGHVRKRPVETDFLRNELQSHLKDAQAQLEKMKSPAQDTLRLEHEALRGDHERTKRELQVWRDYAASRDESEAVRALRLQLAHANAEVEACRTNETTYLAASLRFQDAHEGELEARRSLAVLEEENALLIQELRKAKADMEEVCKELVRTHREAEDARAKATEAVREQDRLLLAVSDATRDLEELGRDREELAVEREELRRRCGEGLRDREALERELRTREAHILRLTESVREEQEKAAAAAADGPAKAAAATELVVEAEEQAPCWRCSEGAAREERLQASLRTLLKEVEAKRVEGKELRGELEELRERVRSEEEGKDARVGELVGLREQQRQQLERGREERKQVTAELRRACGELRLRDERLEAAKSLVRLLHEHLALLAQHVPSLPPSSSSRLSLLADMGRDLCEKLSIQPLELVVGRGSRAGEGSAASEEGAVQQEGAGGAAENGAGAGAGGQRVRGRGGVGVENGNIRGVLRKGEESPLRKGGEEGRKVKFVDSEDTVEEEEEEGVYSVGDDAETFSL